MFRVRRFAIELRLKLQDFGTDLAGLRPIAAQRFVVGLTRFREALLCFGDAGGGMAHDSPINASTMPTLAPGPDPARVLPVTAKSSTTLALTACLHCDLKPLNSAAKAIISDCLAKHDGNATHAAAELGVSLRAMFRWIADYPELRASAQAVIAKHAQKRESAKTMTGVSRPKSAKTRVGRD